MVVPFRLQLQETAAAIHAWVAARPKGGNTALFPE
jgi:hypothetical protein